MPRIPTAERIKRAERVRRLSALTREELNAHCDNLLAQRLPSSPGDGDAWWADLESAVPAVDTSKVNRSEVIALTAERAEEDPRLVEHIIDVLFDLCGEVLARGESVNIRRFGKLEPRLRRATSKPNPSSGEIMEIPERLGVAFLASDILRDRLNRDRAA